MPDKNFIKKLFGDFYYHLLLLIIILIAYFPIAFQFLSLKNDIVQLDLPIKYFISKEIHRGQLPVWMYSWAGGFPLGHMFTWSIYNPVTLVFTTLFSYDLSTLHFEYIFYLFLGGCGIIQVCRKHLYLTGSAATIGALLYVLSGITISCSQFMAYMATIAFLPWVYYCYVLLVKFPSIINSLYFSLSSYLLISWSYPAGIIICFYTLLGLSLISLIIYKKQLLHPKFLLSLSLSAIVLFILCLPLIYITKNTLPDFSRSEELYITKNDFGYLHPSSLITFFFPFFNTDSKFINSTFLFQNVNVGIIGLSILSIGFINIKKIQQHKKTILWLSIGAFITLILACGEVLYVKAWLNEVLPGFKWFRFPSFFRIFFLFFISILIAIFLDAKLNTKVEMSILKNSKGGLLFFAALASIICFYKLYLMTGGFNETQIKNFFTVDHKLKIITLVFFAWTIGLVLYIVMKYKSGLHLKRLIVIDLIITAILSLPLYAVSNYSLSQMKEIIKIEEIESPAISIKHNGGVYVDANGNSFNGLNVYVNKIDIKDQYWGPLYLKSYNELNRSEYVYSPPSDIIFISGDSGRSRVTMNKSSFENHTFTAQVESPKPQEVMLFQVAHPFWKAYIDNIQTPIFKSREGLMFVKLEGGSHEVSFVFKDSLLQVFNLVFFITFPTLLLFIFIIKWRNHNVSC